MLIDVYKVGKNFGFEEIFENISFSVNTLDRIALVGRNGCGKSTMLRMIAGIEVYTGSITLAKGLKLGFLQQTAPDQSDDRLVSDILHEPFGDLFREQKNLEQMENKMTTIEDENQLLKYIEKYSERQEKFISLGGYEIENSIAYVVNGLKIDKKLLSQRYNSLSGGEKTLVHFARILLENPDVLLLDEPTNHLDIERIEWLEMYLSKFKGAVLLVSHDRYFLDKCIKRIIDLEDGGEKYEGNYSYFVKEKEAKELREFEQYKNEQKKIAELKAAVKRLYEWGMKADNPSMFRRAKAIQKRIDAMEENATNKPQARQELNLNVISADRSGDIVCDIKDFSLILGDKILFDNASAQIRVKDKVAIVGNNGTGKSSLIKCILKEYSDYIGSIKIGASVKLGYLPQLLTFENPKDTILKYMTDHTMLKEEGARRLLAKYDFYKDDVEKTVGNLSGGEKVRIKIACMLDKPINTFVFDEPTNHIDIYTRETLEESMKNFGGTILFVSHDRYFIDSVANKILEIKDSKLKMYNGNYSDYKKANEPVVEIKTQDKPKPQKIKISKGGKWS